MCYNTYRIESIEDFAVQYENNKIVISVTLICEGTGNSYVTTYSYKDTILFEYVNDVLYYSINQNDFNLLFCRHKDIIINNYDLLQEKQLNYLKQLIRNYNIKNILE